MSDLAIAGYASLFWAPDAGRDVVAAGAFAESLAVRPGAPMLHGHDPGRPVGVWDELREDARGLHVRGRICGDTAAGRLCQALHRAGRLDGLSIGFRARRARRSDGGRLRVLAGAVIGAVDALAKTSLGGGSGTLADALAGAVGGLFGGARADGGPVASGGAYLVGERGPEVFRPGSGGAIEPVSGAAGGVTVNVTVGDGGAPALLRSEAQVSAALARAVALGRR